MRNRLKDQNQSSNIVLLILVTPLKTLYPTVPTMQPDRLSLDSLPDKSPHLFNSTPSVCSTGFQLEMWSLKLKLTSPWWCHQTLEKFPVEPQTTLHSCVVLVMTNQLILMCQISGVLQKLVYISWISRKYSFGVENQYYMGISIKNFKIITQLYWWDYMSRGKKKQHTLNFWTTKCWHFKDIDKYWHKMLTVRQM